MTQNTSLNLAVHISKYGEAFKDDTQLVQWITACLNCNTNNARVAVQKISVPCLLTAGLHKVNQAFDDLNALLDHSGALESESLQRAAYKLRLEIARAMGDDERAAVAERSLSESSAPGDTLAGFLEVLGRANSVIVCDDAVCHTWSTSPVTGEANNQVVHFTWTDDDGRNQSVILTEDGVSKGQWIDRSFFCEDHEGEELQISVYGHKSLTPWMQIPAAMATQSKSERSEVAEVFPGATRAEVASVMMQDIVGDYEVPDTVPEWQWIEREAAYNHARNGQNGIWEFVLNLACQFDDVPAKLKPVIEQARANHQSYIIFHQGT